MEWEREGMGFARTLRLGALRQTVGWDARGFMVWDGRTLLAVTDLMSNALSGTAGFILMAQAE